MRKKKDGAVRVILNLKKLNEQVISSHFKIETLRSTITLRKPNVYFGSCGLKDTYYSLNIQPSSEKNSTILLG